MNYLQQGDVLLKKCNGVPAGMKKLNHGIVAEGEATGHAHRLAGNNYELYEHPQKHSLFIVVKKPTKLTHEEHGDIDLPPGDYFVDGVKEYDHFNEEARRVVD